MSRHLRAPALLLLVVLGLTALSFVVATPAARAESEDIVRSLDATYDVQRDGTIDVTYRLDWDFGRTGAHGIELSLVTVEEWEEDPLQEAVYKISDLTVSSPSGVPTALDSYESSETLELRIGDPDIELDVDRATYEVKYTLSGAMRTFDGKPQLYWDVTSADFPPIENFTVTVTGPSALSRAQCLQGSDDCATKVSGNRAVLRGGEVEPYDTLTAVTEFAPGSIENAEPELRERDLYSPALLAMNATVTVGVDGVAHVEERLEVKPTPNSSYVTWEIPQRRSLSWSRDQIFEILDVRITDSDGTPLRISHETQSEGGSRQRDEIDAELPDGSEDAETVELVATYRVDGAVVSDGTGPATFIWPISTFESRDSAVEPTERVTWKLPAEVSRLDCRYQNDLVEQDGNCYIDDQLSFDGKTATFHQPGGEGSGPAQWIVIEFSADSLGTLVPATDWSETARGLGITGLTIASMLIFPVLGWLLSRVRLGEARDQHYDGVPLGTMGSNTNVSTARPDGPIPTRFTPPDASLLQLGLVLDRKVRPRHLAATLINMAVNGAVRLRSKPLAMWEQDAEKLTSSFERSLYRRAKPADSDGELSAADKVKMAKLFESEAKQAVNRADLVRPIPMRGPTTLVWALGPALAILAGATAAVVSGWIGWLPVGPGIAALLGVGIGVGVWQRPRVLTAKATALAQQALGFQQYLRGTESNALNAATDADVYHRYLPWAVLFGDVKQWTTVCRELAAGGRIPEPDTSFMIGLGSLDHLSRDLRGFTSSVSPSTSSGGSGSGGSSGFSGGASGGGGGGGTSASSW